MAVQLKRNALHFASSLEANKAVVESAQSKLEGNMSFMESQRRRLKVLSGKMGGTTWLTLGIVLVTILVFVVMVGVMRILRICARDLRVREGVDDE
jgi:SNARE protein 1